MKAASMSFKQQQGAGMVEVLVAIVIFSLGLLGMAGLQATGVKANYSAYVSAQAAQYAYDMADRMRANRAAARSGNYDLDMADPAPACGDIVTCDQEEWLADIATLPAGDGSIVVNGDIITIVVQWNDERAGGAAASVSNITIESSL